MREAGYGLDSDTKYDGSLTVHLSGDGHAIQSLIDIIEAAAAYMVDNVSISTDLED